MRVDLPTCGFAFCRYECDNNCIAKEAIRERCEYLMIDNKIRRLKEVAKLYEELIKKHPKYMYRLNAIEAILETLYELKEWNGDADIWMECYREDAKK